MNREELKFYSGKRVLVTGHTGFKGSWLCKILMDAGAEVTGYGLEPPTNPNLLADQRIHQTASQWNKHKPDDHHFYDSHFSVPPCCVIMPFALSLCADTPVFCCNTIYSSVFIPDSAEKTDDNQYDWDHGPYIHLHRGLPFLHPCRFYKYFVMFILAYPWLFLQFISFFLTYL